MMDLSIVIPSIRTENWDDLLNSIDQACLRHTYEVIFVGPYLDNATQDAYMDWAEVYDRATPGMKVITDWGSPNRCQQIGACNATGDVIFCGADDCLFVPDGIDRCLDRLQESGKDVLTCNYTEDGNKAVQDFSLRACYPPCRQIKHEWVIFNNAFIKRKAFEEVGGYDCRFQVTCFGHADLAARMQSLNYKVVQFDFELMHCSHEPGVSGTHGPIHIAQLTEDTPLYQEKHDQAASAEWVINMDNWKQSPAFWSKRYA